MTFQNWSKGDGWSAQGLSAQGLGAQGLVAAPNVAFATEDASGTRTGAVPKILYVEDNDDNVYLIRMRFDLIDAYRLLVAEDGEAAIALARAEQPDLILMDLELPGIDGWEAARRLKADSATHAIPIIALSAHALSGAREKALAAGCDEFDTKPIDFDRLLAKIEAVLGKEK
jgi:two-component system cell cycle response regulator DivK